MRYKHENEDGTTELQRARPTQELKELRKLKKADYKTDAGFKDLEEFLCKEALNTKPIYDIKLDYVKRMNEEAKTNAEIMKSAKTSLMRETRAQELGFKSAEERAERHETWLQWKKLDIDTRRAARQNKANEEAANSPTTTAESVPSPAVVEIKQGKRKTPEPAIVAIPRSNLEMVAINKLAELKEDKEKAEKTRAGSAEITKITERIASYESLVKVNRWLVEERGCKPFSSPEERENNRLERKKEREERRAERKKKAAEEASKKAAATAEPDTRRRLAEDDDCRTFREALRAVRGY